MTEIEEAKAGRAKEHLYSLRVVQNSHGSWLGLPWDVQRPGITLSFF